MVSPIKESVPDKVEEKNTLDQREILVLLLLRI